MFNRPHKAAQVFERIRQARPPKMFIAVDGARPNRPGEAEKVRQCQDFKNLVDWECDLKVNFAEENMGCKNRIASAITWAFEHVDELIILEDDCLPDVSFFRFCRELLDKYRDYNRIFTIGGSNRDFCEPFEESYAFTRGRWIWGWATWKRAWKTYDITIKLWSKFRQDKYLKNIFFDGNYRNALLKEYQLTYEGKIDTWDYEWSLTCLINHGLHIVPKVNLVRNTGFEIGSGTNVHSPTIHHLYMDEAMTFPLKHPDIMSPLDSLLVPLTEPENPREKIEFYKECERTFDEYDAIFRQLLNLKQFHAVIILFKSVLKKRITPQLTQRHLTFMYYNALAYFNLGDYEHAEAMIEILLVCSPKNIDLLILSANISMSRRNFKKAYELVALMKTLNVTNGGHRAQIDNLANALKTLI